MNQSACRCWCAGRAALARMAGCWTPCLTPPTWLPTLLGLAGLEQPTTIEGLDYSATMKGAADNPGGGTAVIACYHPFADWAKGRGGREYRGLRTTRYTYVRDRNAPWLLLRQPRGPLSDDQPCKHGRNKRRCRQNWKMNCCSASRPAAMLFSREWS